MNVFSLSPPSKNSRSSSSPRAMARGVSRYPGAKAPLRREVHAPSRVTKFGLSSRTSQRHRGSDSSCSTRQESGNDFGEIFLRNYDDAKLKALSALSYLRKDKDVVDVDNEPDNVVVISEDDEIMEIEVIDNGVVTVNEMEENVAVEEGDSAMEVKKMDEGNVGVDSPSNMWSSLVLNRSMANVSSFETYRKFLGSAKNRTSRLKDLGFTYLLKERCLTLLKGLLPLWKQAEETVKEVPREPFTPLSKEEENVVKRALSANSWDVLVSHKKSNIDITGQNLRCLRPGQWLNDEVVNIYLVLLKEREAREPKKFLKCHFFNTFFYTKLASSEAGYNYNAVRRWTSLKRLGYRLIDCDKIFVPIHMSIHWTLAVINRRDKKFQYLDSFKGREPRVLDTLARYFVDEVRDKSGEDIDVSSWKQEFVQDLPLQKNGHDCGMFMLKYIDFYSRGLDLCFGQEHMPCFRVRTAKEILQLKAD
ncbi:PREDICTED: ubiquitin-like-specific protease 1A isoform X1 [Tarenaya hassleriana]|uniref:ubiquitin-like-specific protease 1A isoform X1 n=1 Tax=Tarenaya hassleriana TaxID=28532 RepID=UPI00053C78B0|nr:PREDICTED: ubiquitin-like-specific protease 1A isoform X1 [Tarenaya hassleriana]